MKKLCKSRIALGISVIAFFLSALFCATPFGEDALLIAGGSAAGGPPVQIIKKEPTTKAEYTFDQNSAIKSGFIDKNINYSIKYDDTGTVSLSYLATGVSLTFDIDNYKDIVELFQQSITKASAISGQGIKSYSKISGQVGDTSMSIEADSAGKISINVNGGKIAKEDSSKFMSILRMVPEVKAKYDQNIINKRNADKLLEDKQDKDEDTPKEQKQKVDTPKKPSKAPVVNKIKKLEKKGSILKDDKYILIYNDGQISLEYVRQGKKLARSMAENQVVVIRITLGDCVNAANKLQNDELKEVAKDGTNTFEVKANANGEKTILWNDDVLTVDECKSVISILRQVDDLKKELRAKNETLKNNDAKNEPNKKQPEKQKAPIKDNPLKFRDSKNAFVEHQEYFNYVEDVKNAVVLTENTCSIIYAQERISLIIESTDTSNIDLEEKDIESLLSAITKYFEWDKTAKDNKVTDMEKPLGITFSFGNLKSVTKFSIRDGISYLKIKENGQGSPSAEGPIYNGGDMYLTRIECESLLKLLKALPKIKTAYEEKKKKEKGNEDLFK